MKREILEKTKTAVEKWAAIHHVDLIINKVKYSGIGSNIHIIVVARKGFENWSNKDRINSLYQYISKNANTNGQLAISRLWMMTEEEYEKLEDIEVS
jgi:hypothetical protein